MGKFHALAGAREDHRMLAHDIAAAQRCESDRTRRALARVAFACVHRAIRELASRSGRGGSA